MGSLEDIKLAIEAVRAGCEYDQASEQFNVIEEILRDASKLTTLKKIKEFLSKKPLKLQYQQPEFSRSYSLRRKPRKSMKEENESTTDEDNSTDSKYDASDGGEGDAPSDDPFSDNDPVSEDEPLIPIPQPVKEDTKTCCACLSEDPENLESLVQETTEILKKITPEQIWFGINHSDLYICQKCLCKVKIIQEFIETCSRALETFKKPELIVKAELLTDEYDNAANVFENKASNIIKTQQVEVDDDDNFESPFGNHDDDRNETEVKEESAEENPPINFRLNGGYCAFCHNFFEGSEKKHQLKSHNRPLANQPFSCLKCKGSSFNTESEFLNHVNFEHLRFRKPVKCSICPLVFEFKRGMELHNDAHNREFECVVCNERFPNQLRLNNHIILKYHQEFYTCKHCNVQFKNEEYKQHKIYCARRHYNQKAKHPVHCDQCGKTLASYASLKIHIQQLHRRDTKNPYICDICDAKLLNRSKLIYHMTKHIKPTFLCPHCGKNFITKQYLKYHIELVHLKNKTYMKQAKPCPYCGDLKFSLNYHIQTVHNGERKWQCNQCTLSLKTKGMLKNHMFSHLNQRPFNCDFQGCSFGSYHLSAVKDHYLKAHGLKLTQAESNRRCKRVEIDKNLLRQEWQGE